MLLLTLLPSSEHTSLHLPGSENDQWLMTYDLGSCNGRQCEMLAKAVQEALASNFDKAISILTRAIAIDPGCPLLFLNRAQVYRQMGRISGQLLSQFLPELSHSLLLSTD